MGDNLSVDIAGTRNADMLAAIWVNRHGLTAPADGPQPSHSIASIQELGYVLVSMGVKPLDPISRCSPRPSDDIAGTLICAQELLPGEYRHQLALHAVLQACQARAAVVSTWSAATASQLACVRRYSADNARPAPVSPAKRLRHSSSMDSSRAGSSAHYSRVGSSAHLRGSMESGDSSYQRSSTTDCTYQRSSTDFTYQRSSMDRTSLDLQGQSAPGSLRSNPLKQRSRAGKAGSRPGSLQASPRKQRAAALDAQRSANEATADALGDQLTALQGLKL